VAETIDELPKTKKNRPQTELWVLAAIAGAAILCVSVLAVALALILGKGSLIQVNPVITAQSPAPVPPAAAPAAPLVQPPLQRSADAVHPPVVRSSAQDRVQAALPGVLATPTVVVEKRSQVVRSDPQAPPSPAFVATAPAAASASGVPGAAPVQASVFRVRQEAANLYNGDHALPMPVHPVRFEAAARPLLSPSAATASAVAAVPAAPGPAPAADPSAALGQPPLQRSIASAPMAQAIPDPAARAVPDPAAKAVPDPAAKAVPDPAAKPLAASVPLAKADPDPSPAADPAPKRAAETGPALAPGDLAYAGGQCQGTLANLQLLSARTTAVWGGAPAPKGNRYFTAHVLVTNKSAAALSVDSGAFDLRDADGDSYMANPEADPSRVPPPVKAGADGEMNVSFLVPDDADLKSLALVLASESDLIPLSKK
jgi:hypothetical protein